MADKLENPNKKFRSEESGKQNQSLEHDGKEALADATHEEKSITNIYYDCLERIFDYLDIMSLLMVAQTCRRLQVAAAAKFGDEYGNKDFILRPFPNIEYVPENFELYYIDDWPDLLVEITVNGLETCLPFLRCFGSKILDLRVQQENHSKNKYFDQYVNQYCADTVIHIKFDCKDRFLFTKPFKNIEKLDLCGARFRNDLVDLKWFPNLRSLKMTSDSIDRSSSGAFVPQLQQVTVYIQRPLNTCPPCLKIMENVREFFHANQQLTCVNINYNLRLESTLTTLLNLISNNSSIFKLEVHSSTRNITMDEINRLTIEHRLIVNLKLYFYELTSDDAMLIIRQLKSLKTIKFIFKNRFEFDRFSNQKDNEWEIEPLDQRYNNIAYTGSLYVSLIR